MKNIYLGLIMLTVCCGQAATDTLIHPKAFSMVSAWLSDSEQPVVTQFSLDAILQNRNEYDYTKVAGNGDWVVFTDEEQRIAYRLKQLARDLQQAHLFAHEGGTLTTYTIITFRIIPKTITRDGQPVTLRVVDVTGIADGQVANKEPSNE